jgi:hypothetical protein
MGAPRAVLATTAGGVAIMKTLYEWWKRRRERRIEIKLRSLDLHNTASTYEQIGEAIGENPEHVRDVMEKNRIQRVREVSSNIGGCRR